MRSAQIAAITNPRTDNNDLVFYTDANDGDTFYPSWTFAPSGTGSRLFNGSTDRIDWAALSTNLKTSPITISAWIKVPSGPGHSSYVLAVHGPGDTVLGVMLYLTASAQLSFYRYGSTFMSAVGSAFISTGTNWTHILVTHPGGGIGDYTLTAFYKSGVADAVSTGQNGATEGDVTGSCSIGGRIYDDARNFPGNIAQVGLWNRVLTAEEIAVLAAANAPNAIPTDLLFYFSGETDSLVATPPGTTGTADGASFDSGDGPTLQPITMKVNYGDGTYAATAVGAPKTYAAGKGRHRVVYSCPDWKRLLTFRHDADKLALFVPKRLTQCRGLTSVKIEANSGHLNILIGNLPSFNWCTGLTEVSAYGDNIVDGNYFTGILPSFEQCVALTVLNVHQCNYYGRVPNLVPLTALTVLDISNNLFSGPITSLSGATNLVTCELATNLLSGELPSFSGCTKLVTFYGQQNAFTGTLPSFNACVLLQVFRIYTNQFSGTMPTFAACTALTEFSAYENAFTAYTAGCFATQKNLATIYLRTNSFDAAAINSILADLVSSLGGGRVACTVDLAGVGNAAPTGQGIVDKATLAAAGWTVSTN